jgi:putative serine protease PepD
VKVKGPRHLWTGDWRTDSRDNAETLDSFVIELRTEPLEEDVATEAAQAPPRTQVRRRRAITAVAALLTAALVVFAAQALIGSGDDNKPQQAKPSSPLAAVPDKPLKPHKGQTRAGAVYDAASPAVVSIQARGDEGTGFLVDKSGTIVTNAHVVNSQERVIVKFGRDGSSIEADVLGTDPSSDLAAVSIPASSIPAGVKPLQFADSRDVRVGDVAIAIGNPFGLDRTATEGIVSAIGRSIEAPNHFSIENVIQTDAPINPGNSGGPLLNDSAHVIGVNAQIATNGITQGNVGIGFAIPSNTVREVLPVIKRGQTIKRAYLGVQTQPPDPGRPSGAQVASLVSGGPADDGGVQVGDVIRSVNGTKILDPSQLSAVVEKYQPGDRVPVVVARGGSSQTLEVTLGTRPASTP